MFEELTRGSPSLTRMGSEVCRWGWEGETIRWTKTWTKIDRIPSIYGFLREGIRQHGVTAQADTGLYIQPYEFGRNAYMEIDYFPVLGEEDRRRQALCASQEFASRSAALGLTGGIVAHAKPGSVYASLEAVLKRTFDLQGILNPRPTAAEVAYQPDVCG